MINETFQMFFVGVLIAGALINTYTDIKGRWAPDYINYGLIIIGLFGHFIQSVLTHSYQPILQSSIGAGLFFVLASTLFYTGQCGGGDAKFWIALGSLLPVYPVVLLRVFSPVMAPWPFLLSLTTNIFIAGAVVGFLFVISSALRKSDLFKEEIRKSYKANKWFVISVLFCVSFPLFFWLVSSEIFILSFLIWILLATLALVKLSSKAIEKSAYKKIKPSQLEEGDWLVDKIKISNVIIYEPSRTGIEKPDINKLIKLEKQKKLKYILVKDGFPFLVSFTLGILVTLVYGDLLLRLLQLII